MKQFVFLLVLVICTLLQISWGQWLSIWGFPLPLTGLALALGLRFFSLKLVLAFAFASGLFYDLLAGGVLGLSALLNLVLVRLAGTFYQRRS